jgi:5-methylcytosine-specific restriction endonuclease McrA
LPIYAKELCAKHYKGEFKKKERELPISKTCKTCQELKMFDQFNIFSLSSDGLSYNCKSCVSKMNHETHKKNPERYRRTKKRWTEANKEKVAAQQKQRRLDDPIKYSLLYKEYRIRNIEKVREKERRYQQQNKEKDRMKAAKRRARKKNNKVFQIIDKDLRRLLNDPCIYCGKPAEHVDHLIPISRGGPHGIGNLAPSCANCNLTKHSKTVYEFKIWRKRINERSQPKRQQP